MSGCLIAIEGIDGTGKSTQVRQLAAWLEASGHAVATGREPTDGLYGRALRRSAEQGRLPATEERSLFMRDRREHVESLINPALAAGRIVVLDRYYFSTMAYQGSRGFDPREIRRENEAFAPVPDLLVVLDLEVKAALARISHRGDRPNHFEVANELTRCREIFLELTDEFFVRIIPAGGSAAEVQIRIQNEVDKILR